VRAAAGRQDRRLRPQHSQQAVSAALVGRLRFPVKPIQL
jgi:hypothetical protein